VIADAQAVLVPTAPSRWRVTRGVVADYVSLAKPRIMLLLLITEFTAMITAGRRQARRITGSPGRRRPSSGSPAESASSAPTSRRAIRSPR